ncbi:S24 family peptidase [Ectothiorhodospiraceae bacterium BW-2]|nr:S24 family peptidase [Ectothiorhodospiraceae bacterium BW-2]
MRQPYYVAAFDDHAVPAEESGAEPLFDSGSCEKAEPYVLMVMGNSMEPEFNDGDIIVIEPSHPYVDGSYVIAWHKGEYIFRQLHIRGEAFWLHPLNSHFADEPLSGAQAIKGVITQKKSPGGRRMRKSYV